MSDLLDRELYGPVARDPLSPARGCIYGCVLGSVVWAAIGLSVWVAL